VKILKSNQLSAFGGLNFVYNYTNALNINSIIKEKLPDLANQSKYNWNDLFYSFSSIFYCGGDCIEDLQDHLKPHFKDNPLFKMCSPDTMLRRFKSLSTKVKTCQTPRGTKDHQYNHNKKLFDLNLSILNKLNVFNQETILDYDNTIIFNEKSDSKMTYKRDYGYQPGVCTINENHILFIENRGGNSDAKSFQSETLKRMFKGLKKSKITKLNHFRADAASYMHEVVDLVQDYVDYFYIACRNSYVEKYFGGITNWEESEDEHGKLEIGSIEITPFVLQSKKKKKTPKVYRMVVKRRPNKDGQINMITQDAYEYRAIITNNFEMTNNQVVGFYARRGNMEKQFDILKNDFGWNNMPFSNLNENLVFLYFSAICRNLYNSIITHFSKKCNSLKPVYRLKKFIFRFIILPAKWIIQGRQNKLRIYSISSHYT
jgi:hypothetical protein